MCRHHPNSICGKSRHFYEEKLNTGRRFRLFICESTQADVAYLLHHHPDRIGAKAMARACGLNFDSSRTGRVLLNKFMQQVMYLEKKMVRAQAAGHQLRFQCAATSPPVLPGVANQTSPQNPVASMTQASFQIPGTPAPAPMFAPTEKTVMPTPNQSVQPMKMLDRHDLDALAEQLGTKIKLENQD
ncbi:uncharacterized protein NECHADRAFT_88848 [Fusarium vanettenii 77-13-4]|uniref:Uncharacterized protein n=1 Tax=Fusarium vanettenii (strain ATCC MYA-4622 / CBS 123669 / FGSC 9596 / NRRL 45880 / 77-13-4) TaxID=660122 RepID=C7ZN33_FUSV7|nr:uncharacterized protein NECHADRAFT_88848 [Fusarium vanettenii 77-13-4]EEU34564.1 predicted protein [Fusarium vanettenii 77-13-4]